MKRACFSVLAATFVLLFSLFNTGFVDASFVQISAISTPIDGAWNGTTSYGKTVAFTVSSGGAQWSSFALQISFYASNCGSTVTQTQTINGPGSITSGTFSNTYNNPSGGTYYFSGQFDSPFTASGTYAYTNYKMAIWMGTSFCYYYLTQSGTWTASTPMPAPAAFNKTAPSDGATSQPLNVTLSWESSLYANSYEYCYSTSNPCTEWNSNGTTTSIALTGLAESTTYYWNVRAVKYNQHDLCQRIRNKLVIHHGFLTWCI